MISAAAALMMSAAAVHKTKATVAANSGTIPLKVLQGPMCHANFHTTMNAYAALDADQMLAESIKISDQYAQIAEKSCRKNCSA